MQGDKQRIDGAISELKRLSRDFKIPVIAISSFNRTSYNKAASMTSFKETGNIEYSSDVLIALQYNNESIDPFGDENGTLSEKQQLQIKADDKPKPIKLVILKDRNAKPGGFVDMKFMSEHNFFYEE